MVWGYSPVQLQQGALAELIDLLEHERLDVRVLAIENLVEATGKRLSYYPANSPSERQLAVRTWRERLNRGELQILSATPMDEARGGMNNIRRPARDERRRKGG